MRFNIATLAAALLFASAASAQSLECTNWQSQHPEWIWCDDFESDAALAQAYFDVNRGGGQFGVSSDTAYSGRSALKAVFSPGVEEAGNVKLGFGRSPVASRVRTNDNFDEVYWRFYTKTSTNWTGNARKVTRATIFAASDWSQAAIGHLWEDSPSSLGMGLDIATGVVGSQVMTSGYNDFSNLRWIGKHNGPTQVYAPSNRDRWFCVEVRMKLNSPGASNGVFAYWVDGRLEAETTSVNWRGSYTAYGINAIMLENYANGGFQQSQSRYYDNFVVSTNRIGCSSNSPVVPRPPTDVTVR